MRKYNLRASVSPNRLWPLDYHECENIDSLVRVLNDIVSSGFILDKIIPQADYSFVVLFRRHDLG